MVRQTAQRSAIRQVLKEADRPLSPPEILKLAQLIVPALGLTTVYRTVNNLVETNWLTPVHLPGEATRYELAGKPPHYFFRCRGCGGVFDVPGREPEIQERVPAGFVATAHEVFFYGLCSSCSIPAEKRARSLGGSRGGSSSSSSSGGGNG